MNDNDKVVKSDSSDIKNDTNPTQLVLSTKPEYRFFGKTKEQHDARNDPNSPLFWRDEPEWLDQLEDYSVTNTPMIRWYNPAFLTGPNNYCDIDPVDTPEYVHDVERAFYKMAHGDTMSFLAQIVFACPDIAFRRIRNDIYKKTTDITDAIHSLSMALSFAETDDVADEIQDLIDKAKTVRDSARMKKDTIVESYGRYEYYAHFERNTGSHIKAYLSNNLNKNFRGAEVSEYNYITSKFDEENAMIFARAMHVSRFSETGKLDRPDTDIYMYRCEDGSDAEFTESFCSEILRRYRTRMPSRNYHQAYLMVCQFAEQKMLVDHSRYVAVANGLIDLEASKKSDHVVLVECPENQIALNRMPLPYIADAYDEDAERFIDAIANHDADNRRHMMQAFGTALSRDIHPAVCCVGDVLGDDNADSSNGKSSMFEFVQNIITEANYSTVPINEVGDRFAKVRTRNMTANFDGDSNSDILSKEQVSHMKKMTAKGDRVAGEKKNVQDTILFKPTATLFFASNTPFKVSSKDNNSALDRRIETVYFGNHFDDNAPDRDDELVERVMKSESSLIYGMKLLVEGLVDLYRNHKHFSKTDYSRRMDLQLKADNNLVGMWLSINDTPFVRDMFIGAVSYTGDLTSSLDAEDFAIVLHRDKYLRKGSKTEGIYCDIIGVWYQVYVAWARKNGHNSPGSLSTFTQSMNRFLGFDSAVGTVRFKDSKTRCDKHNIRIFKSKPNYKDVASGLELPALDSKCAEVRAKFKVAEEQDKLAAMTALLDCDAVLSQDLPFNSSAEEKLAYFFNKTHGVLKHPFVLPTYRVLTYSLMADHKSFDSNREALGARIAAYKKYLDYLNDDSIAHTVLSSWELTDNFVYHLSEAAAERAIDCAPELDSVMACIATPESEAERIEQFALNTRESVVAFVERLRNASGVQKVVNIEQYHALISSVLAHVVEKLDAMLVNDATVDAAIKVAERVCLAGCKPYTESLEPPYTHRLHYIACVTAGVGADVVTVDDVLGEGEQHEAPEAPEPTGNLDIDVIEESVVVLDADGPVIEDFDVEDTEAAGVAGTADSVVDGSTEYSADKSGSENATAAARDAANTTDDDASDGPDGGGAPTVECVTDGRGAEGHVSTDVVTDIESVIGSVKLE